MLTEIPRDEWVSLIDQLMMDWEDSDKTWARPQYIGEMLFEMQSIRSSVKSHQKDVVALLADGERRAAAVMADAEKQAAKSRVSIARLQDNRCDHQVVRHMSGFAECDPVNSCRICEVEL
jgi:hypothetical protein